MKGQVTHLTIEELVNQHYDKLNATDLLIGKSISNYKKRMLPLYNL